MGLTEEQLRYVGADPLPPGVYDDAEATVVDYARRSTRMEPIDDELYGRLERHFSKRQQIELCFTVGMSNMVNRFHATFLTELDPETGRAVAEACPLPVPPSPAR